MAEPEGGRAVAAIDVTEYGTRRALIVAGVMMAALLQTLDATIVNVAMPIIEGNIGASIDDGTWIITGYIISNVVAIPLAPYLMQRLGRKQYFLACIAGFTIASFLCGTATSLVQLVLYRVVQGAFGGGLIATSQVILRDTFPKEKLGTSSAIFAIALTVGPALGPTLGGYLTDAISWQWVFDINIVPGALALAILALMLRNAAPPRAIPFDGVGVALLAAAFGAMQFVLDEGERNDWFDSPTIVAFAALFVVALAGFIAWELSGTRTPIVDLRVFRYRNVRVAVPAAILMGMVIFGPTVMLPQYVQHVLGFTATQSGLLILTRAFPVIVLTLFVARLLGRIDTRVLLTFGFATSAASFWLISTRMTSESDFSSFTFALVLSGIGQVTLLVPLLTAVFATVAPIDAPKSSSFLSLSVQLGGSIASTVLVTVYDRRTFFHADVMRSAATPHNATAAALLRAPGGLAEIARLIGLQASNAGFADAIAFLIPVAVVALVPVWLLTRRRPA